MRIDTPVLNTELVLEQPVRALDTGGGAEIVWAELGTLRAEIEAVSADTARTCMAFRRSRRRRTLCTTTIF